MGTKDRQHQDKWHLLFDAVCRERGHQGNAVLASEFCACSGRNTRADFESARKQLRAWRSGTRLPLKRNVLMLAKLLEIDSDAQLANSWQELYRRAQAQRAGMSSPGDTKAEAARTGSMWLSSVGAATIAGVVLVLGLGALLSPVLGERRVIPADLPIVNFEGWVRVPVGSSVLIHGRLADCDGSPERWDDFADEIPSTPVGAFSDGGLARKVMRKCTSEKIVRGIRFTGAEPGTDSVRLFGDYIRIDVLPVRRAD